MTDRKVVILSVRSVVPERTTVWIGTASGANNATGGCSKRADALLIPDAHTWVAQRILRDSKVGRRLSDVKQRLGSERCGATSLCKYGTPVIESGRC